MSTTNIKQSWSLVTFVKENGRMQVGDFTNKETGEIFTSCIFTKDDGERCFASFSSNLGVLTPAEISARKNELQIVEMQDTGKYILCKKGTPETAWQDVDI